MLIVWIVFRNSHGKKWAKMMKTSRYSILKYKQDEALYEMKTISWISWKWCYIAILCFALILFSLSNTFAFLLWLIFLFSRWSPCGVSAVGKVCDFISSLPIFDNLRLSVKVTLFMPLFAYCLHSLLFLKHICILYSPYFLFSQVMMDHFYIVDI